MKDHKELNKLVVSSLEFYESKGINPTAKEMYKDIKSEQPRATKSFKSFTKIISFLPNVAEVKKVDGVCIYKKI